MTQGNRISFCAQHFSGSGSHVPTFLTPASACTDTTPTGHEPHTVQTNVSQLTRAKRRSISGTFN